MYSRDDRTTVKHGRDDPATVNNSPAPQKIGIPYLVLITLSDTLLARGASIIELFDNELLIGKAEVASDNEFTPVIAWGGYEEYKIAGFTKGHPIMVHVLASDGSLLAAKIDGKFGEGAFAEINLNKSSSAAPTEFVVGAVYPNPCNPIITVPFSLSV